MSSCSQIVLKQSAVFGPGRAGGLLLREAGLALHWDYLGVMSGEGQHCCET